ncbi:MAG: DUF547 domain-containing protein [Bacteroidota bacterium]
MTALVHHLAAFAVLVTGVACSGCLSSAQFTRVVPAGPVVQVQNTFDHSAYDRVLKTYVDRNGLVDYAGLLNDRAGLDGYLERLAATDPSNLGRSEQLAFWINAYNAYAIKLVLDNYPTESILDVTGGPFVPKVNSPFQVKFANVGGEDRTLDEIEHGIIRPQFNDPRIHFVVICAAISCPPLRAEAFTGAKLDQQLDEQGRIFLADESKNRFDGETATFSKIFDWYKGDFGGSDDSLQRYLATFAPESAQDGLERAAFEVEFGDYDWSLNEQ